MKKFISSSIIINPKFKIEMDFDKLVKRNWFDLHGRAFNDDDIDVHIKAIEQSTVLEMLYLNDNKLTLVDGKLKLQRIHH